MTEKIREAFEKWWNNSITTQEWKSQKEYAFMGYQAALSSLEPLTILSEDDPINGIETLYRIKTQQDLSLEELSALGQELSPDEYQP